MIQCYFFTAEELVNLIPPGFSLTDLRVISVNIYDSYALMFQLYNIKLILRHN